MTDKFREYVTSASFRLDLSNAMIEALLALDKGYEFANKFYWSAFHYRMQSLERRGLVQHKPEVGRCYEITEAGKLVAKLLKLAGFKFEEKREAA